MTASLAAALLCSACGGSAPEAQGATPTTSGTTLSNTEPTAPVASAASAASATGLTASQKTSLLALGQAEALPSHQLAPVIYPEPGSEDVSTPNASALLRPMSLGDVRIATPRGAKLTTADLLRGSTRMSAMAATPLDNRAYTPAQIRAAYGLPVLPAVTATLSDQDAARLGAGQTIFVVNAYHNPTTTADLTAFNTKFGLPQCKTVALAPTAKLSAAQTRSCEFVTVYIDGAGARTATAPAYSEMWADEISLDVQWAHAIAPLARIVLVEAKDENLSSLAYAVLSTGDIGPGIVSMSFGTPEGSWGPQIDFVFEGSGQTYVAAAGDTGYQASWPAVSPKVLAVGGTSLRYDGPNARTETVWTGSGGAPSAYFAQPRYQAMLGTAALSGMRTASDVALNADPATGQLTARSQPGSATTTWHAFGGTSVAAPQWAGILAVANAMRTQVSREPMQSLHDAVYDVFTSGGAAKYSASFNDITSGSNGNCALCKAGSGYDIPTGMGTPQAGALLPYLASYGPAIPAPVLAGAQNTTTRATTPFSQQLSATQAGVTVFTYSLSGAPAGMTIDSKTGLIKWASPVVGSYSIKALATGRLKSVGESTFSLVVKPANRAPIVKAATYAANTGVTFSGGVTVSDADGDAVTLSMTGAPAGLLLAQNGALSWASPVKGQYSVSVTAVDAYGAKGVGVMTLVVTNVNHAPLVTADALQASVGQAVSYKLLASDPDGDTLTFVLSGAPYGMSVSAGVLKWANPVVGNYAITVTARDPLGLTASAVIKVVATQPNRAPTATSLKVTWKVGVDLLYKVVVADPDGDALSLSLIGAPAGMSVDSATRTIKWPSPVKGTFNFQMKTTDPQGLSVLASMTVVIN